MALRKAQAAARGCRRKVAAAAMAVAGMVHGGLKSCWLARKGAGGGRHTVYLILSRFRGVSVVKLLSASFFADDDYNIFFAPMMYSANTLSLLLDSF